MPKSSKKQNNYQSITEFYDGKSIFITGAAGFLGVVLLESLLRIFSGIQSVYILLRPKKGMSPQERKKEILSRTIFNELKKTSPNVFEKIHVVEGDVSLPNMGMSDEDLLKITENVTIVFHCAASINFFKPFRYIFKNNVVGVNNAIELCKKLKNRCEVLVDTSTAYSNCNHDLILEERIYGIPYPAERFLEYYEKEDDEALQQLRSEIKPDFPNHYVFCKYISENLILEKCTDIPSVIIRPSLISSTWKGPLPGYVEVQSSMAQFSIGISKGFVKIVFADPEVNLELIPVDIVVNTHIVAAYSVATGRYPSPFVVNCTSYGLPLQYSTLTPLYLRFFRKYPIPNAFRYSTHVWIVDNMIEKIFLSIFEHYIPAAVMDLMLILKGKKPKVFSLYRFLDRITEVTSYFTTKRFEFATENLRDLKNTVSPEKAEELYTDLDGLNLKDYVKDLLTGAPQYDWKNDKKSKTERIKLMKRIYYFTLFIQVLSIILLFWVLYAAFCLVAHLPFRN